MHRLGHGGGGRPRPSPSPVTQRRAARQGAALGGRFRPQAGPFGPARAGFLKKPAPNAAPPAPASGKPEAGARAALSFFIFS